MRERLLSETRGVRSWCPRVSKNRNDYLQADMESVSSVCAVATQDTWELYKEDNNGKAVKSETERTGRYECKFCVASRNFVVT